MKNKVKLHLMTVLLLLAFAACSDDESSGEHDGEETSETGQPFNEVLVGDLNRKRPRPIFFASAIKATLKKDLIIFPDGIMPMRSLIIRFRISAISRLVC